MADNWWDNDPIVESTPSAATAAPADEDKWWEADPTVDQEDPVIVPSPDGGFLDEMNTARDAGEFNAVPSEQEDTGVLRSQSEIYSTVNDQSKYKPLDEYEGSWGSTIGPNIQVGDANYSIGQGLNPFGDNFGQFRMPPELEQLKKEREAEREAVYNRTGQADTIGGVIPVRTQEKVENNPNFDPALPAGPDNPETISNRYLVDAPDLQHIQRMGYQVLRNIVGGVGDFATEGKILSEGKIGKSLPNTVPDQTGEKFVDDMSTFALGAAGVQRVAGKLGGLALGTAGKAAQMMSPEATQAIRVAYETTLKSTGNVVAAKAAANSVTRNMLVGMSFLGRATKTGVAEAIVAPGDSDSLVSPAFFERSMGVSPERAKDYAMIADSPLIGSTLNTFGGIYGALKERIIKPTFGGIRNLDIMGIQPGKLPITQKEAGFRFILNVDPNIGNLSPEDAAFKIKVLSDAIQRHGSRELSIAGASKSIPQDTPTAYAQTAEDYFRVAYADKKDTMGAENFNQWVKDQAASTSQFLFEVRTHLKSNETAAKGSARIIDLLDESKNAVAGGNLVDAQNKTTQIAKEQTETARLDADAMEKFGQQEADDAKLALDRGISDDPEFKLFMDEANAELGSKSGVNDLVHGKMSDKTYQALKKLKGDTDDAYGNIAATGAEGDSNSILEIIKDFSEVGEDGSVKITDPFLRKIANEVNQDSSFGNLYNNVRNQINKQINIAQKSNDVSKLDALYQLRDNINNDQLDFLVENGDEGMEALVKNAKEKYIQYKSTFGEPENKTLKDAGENRLRGEKFDPGATAEGQGKTNWDVTFGNKIQQLDSINGKPLRDSLRRAAKAGGQDIDGDLANYYATKAITNMANSASAGTKQSVGELRSNISGVIEGLQGINSPMVPKLKALEAKLQTLENTAVDKEAALKSIKEQADLLRKEANDSVLTKFLYQNKDTVEPTEVGRTMKTIFRGNKSVSEIKDLMKRADTMGERGQPIKDALKGSYMDYLKDRLQSKQVLGLGEPGASGEARSAYRMSETQADKLFDEGGNDLANLKTIFKDEPEIVNTLEELRAAYQNLSKKTPSSNVNPLGRVDRGEDPEQALNSAITFTMGVLNPRASKARRLTASWGANSLEQVRLARSAILTKMMEDPQGFADIARKVGKGLEAKAMNAEVRSWFGRGIARATTSQIIDRERDRTVDNEMKKLK